MKLHKKRSGFGKIYLGAYICGFLFILVCFHTANAQKKDILLYKNASLPVDERMQDLIKRMTLKEKIAQLSHLHGYQIYTGQSADLKKLEQAAGKMSYGCVEGFTLSGPNCSRAMYVIQKYMMEKTRLGIPVLTVTESLHGSVQDGSTIFPQTVAIGSSFNTDLAYRMTAAISKELNAQGMRHSLSPGLDVVRDLRWGRVEEAFGEDPWLVGQMGIAQVQGYLDNGIEPMLKPFGPGGAPLGGLNLASVECGERDMRDIYLKPYEMVVKSTDVMAVMTSYNSWNRIPNSSSHFLLTDILRNEWGFRGYVYSDWGAVSMLRGFHHTAKDDADAAKQALMAGLDLEASSDCYKELEELVIDNELDEKYIDQAVERVLRTKFEMGLFENPYSDTTGYHQKVHSPEAIKLSREIADESIVLVKNEKEILPLNMQTIKSIAVIGPNADQVQFGDYTWSRNNKDGVTPLQGIKQLVNGRIQVNYAKGCDLMTDDKSGFNEALEVALKSEVSVIFAGSSSASLARDYNNVTTGEGFDLSDLSLTGMQEELIRTIYATGKPVVVVLVTGKPFTIPWIKQNIPALVVQWYGGERCGDAIANMLFGNTNPSAKLPFSFPQSVGHLPAYYNYLPTDKGYYKRPGSPDTPGRDYVFSSPDPLWSFGHGLSYTNFKYQSAEFSDTILHAGDTLKVKIKVQNSGKRAGKEVVQLYVRDLVSSVVMPVKQLKAFAKPFIKAGETVEVLLNVPVSELALYNLEMKRVVEPGEFEIQIGGASDQIRLKKVVTFADTSQTATGKINVDRSDSVSQEQTKSKFPQKVITVSGEIRDVQATPMGNVKVKSVKLGKEIITKRNGKYAIGAFSNDTLIFSARGYQDKVIQVNNQNSINLRMERSLD